MRKHLKAPQNHGQQTDNRHLAQLDIPWLCMTMYDYVWLCMTMNDYVWLCMTMYGYV